MSFNDIQTDLFSFKTDFLQYSLLKKFFVIVFLPLIPIYIISKGFQLKKWKNLGSESKKPSATKYYVTLIIIYIITYFPINISAYYIIAQVVLFPFSFFIALYLHSLGKKPMQKPEIGEEFRVIGFRKLSFSFLILLLFTWFFSFMGIFWLIFALPTFFFIIRPQIYKKLYFFPRYFIVLSNSFFSFLSYIPGVNLDGVWFLERDSEVKRMSTIFDVVRFVSRNYEIFLIGNIGISAMVLRILVLLRGEPELSLFFDINGVRDLGFFLGIFWIVPIIMAIYIVWALVWEDAELKIAKIKISSAGKLRENDQILETTLLTQSSRSIQRIFGLFFGVPAIIWLIDKLNVGTESGPLTGFALTFSVAIVAFVAFFITGVATIFMAVMYYRSGVHEKLVNQFRSEIIELNEQGDFSVIVGNFELKPLIPKNR